MHTKKIIAAITEAGYLEQFHNLVTAMSKSAVFSIYTKEERTVGTHTRGWQEWEETYTDQLAEQALGKGLLVDEHVYIGLANCRYFYRRVENQEGGTIVSHGNRRRSLANVMSLKVLHDHCPELFLSKYFKVTETPAHGWTAWVYPRIQFNPVEVDKLVKVLNRRDAKSLSN